jgi:hypothetical protein
MWRRVALVRTDISEERSASIMRVTRIGELGTTLAVNSNVLPSSPILVTLMMEDLSSSETSVLTRSTLSSIPEDGFTHSHSREILKSYETSSDGTCVLDDRIQCWDISNKNLVLQPAKSKGWNVTGNNFCALNYNYETLIFVINVMDRLWDPSWTLFLTPICGLS